MISHNTGNLPNQRQPMWAPYKWLEKGQSWFFPTVCSNFCCQATSRSFFHLKARGPLARLGTKADQPRNKYTWRNYKILSRLQQLLLFSLQRSLCLRRMLPEKDHVTAVALPCPGCLQRTLRPALLTVFERWAACLHCRWVAHLSLNNVLQLPWRYTHHPCILSSQRRMDILLSCCHLILEIMIALRLANPSTNY